MTLTAEQISQNWNDLLQIIEDEISSPRKEKLLEFYKSHEDKLVMLPAANKVAYHSAFPGGYIYHVLNVIKCSIATSRMWDEMGADITTYTREELIFAAINHDLGKMGDGEDIYFLPQTDDWRKKNLGETYIINDKLPFMAIPQRGLWLLSNAGITITQNEYLAILTHDGIYDEGNKPYYMGWNAETKPRTCLIYVMHHADLMAARIEFEGEYPHLLHKNLEPQKTVRNIGVNNNKKQQSRDKALSKIKSTSLQSAIDSI